MKDWFMRLAPRERLMVSAAAVVVIVALLYVLGWEPLASRIAHLEQSVTEQQALKQWMDQAAVEAKQLRGTSRVRRGGTQSLLAVVDQTAKRSHLGAAVKRIQPEGQDQVRVSLEQASFDDMVMWLGSLQSQGISVIDATMDRQSGAGRVNARITLKKGGA